jgi:serine/threonine protein kinase
MASIDRDNSFELIKELGGGGFGTTYQSRILNRDILKSWKCEEIVAIKMPKDEKCAIYLSKEIELNNTIKTVCSVNELEYFCEVYGTHAFSSSTGPKLIMIMKYMPEGNLRSRIENNLLDFSKSINYVKDILQGLSIMHNNRIIHRDIKPENILFMNDRPRIVDLGIGKALHSNEYARTTIGTLCYMSPEILMGEKGATFNTDIWSLGIMMHEMLYGCLPFGIDEESAQGQIVEAIRHNEDFNSPERIDIPDEIVAILHKSLTKDYKKRYRSAQEMIEDIENYEMKNIKESADYKMFLEKRKNHEYEGAITILENLINKYPVSPNLYIDLGQTYLKQSKINKAIDILNVGIEKVHDHGDLYFEAGILLNQINEKQKTIEYLQNSLKFGIAEKNKIKIAQTLIKKLTDTK